jgi:hypothetical protein
MNKSRLEIGNAYNGFVGKPRIKGFIGRLIRR